MKQQITKTKEHKKYTLIMLFLFFHGIAFSQALPQIGEDIDGEFTGDASGYSVSISGDGNRVAIGAPFNDGIDIANTTRGHVRIYERKYGVWSLIVEIDGKFLGEELGRSVAISTDGTTVAIGAPENEQIGSRAGTARVYRQSGGKWVQLGHDLNGTDAFDRFGTSVSLSADGNIVAVGTPFSNRNAESTGHVRVFKYEKGSWRQFGSDIVGEQFRESTARSISLSADGRRIAIGGTGATRSSDGLRVGRTKVYQLGGSKWNELDRIDGETQKGHSGWAVSLSADGTIVAIGAPRNDGINNDKFNTGTVRVFRQSAGGFVQIGNNIDGESAADELGFSVALSADGKKLAVGAPSSDGDFGNTTLNIGRVKIFEEVGGVWSQIHTNIDGEARRDASSFSLSLSADGNTVAIGSIANRNNVSGEAGHVRVYGEGFIPGGLECSIVDATHNLSWPAITGASRYEIEILVNDTRCCAVRAASFVENFTVTNNVLKYRSSGHCFSWKVKAVYPNGISSPFSDRVCSCEGDNDLFTSSNSSRSEGSKNEIDQNISLEINSGLDVSAAPNPAEDILTIVVSDQTNIRKLDKAVVSIVDLSGKEVYRSKISINRPKNIHVDKFEGGIYLYKIIDLNSNEVIKSAKLIVK